MILTIPELKSRFVSKDRPSAKDFSDFVDTVIGVAQQTMAAEINAAIAAAISAIPTIAPLISTVVLQSTPPNASFKGSLWVKLDPITGAVIRTYNFAADNYWHSRHPVNPGSIVLITDPTFNLAGLPTYDGGGSPGMGAMWTQATELVGKFALGASGSTFPINSTGGSATVTLGIGDNPSHSHSYAGVASAETGGPTGFGWGLTASSNILTFDTETTGAAGGGGGSHNNMPPYQTCYFIKRTSRTDFVEAPGI